MAPMTTHIQIDSLERKYIVSAIICQESDSIGSLGWDVNNANNRHYWKQMFLKTPSSDPLQSNYKNLLNSINTVDVLDIIQVI